MKFEILSDEIAYGVNSIKVRNDIYRIINLNATNLDEYDRLLAEFDYKVPASLLKSLPFDSVYKFSSPTFSNYQDLFPTGIHYSKDGLESVKVFLPKGTQSAILGIQNPSDSTWEDRVLIELEYDEPKYDSIIEFSTDIQNRSNNLPVLIHTENLEVDKTPHLDTQLAVNLQHTKLQLSELQINAIVQRSGVIGNTYIDQSGRMHYIGDHHV